MELEYKISDLYIKQTLPHFIVNTSVPVNYLQPVAKGQGQDIIKRLQYVHFV